MRDPQIDKLIQDLKTKKFREGEAKGLMDKTGEELKKQFGPAVAAAIKEGLSGIKMPEMPQMPAHPPQAPQVAPIVNVPAPIVRMPAPIVNVPAPIVNIPKTVIPPYPDFPTEMGIAGVDKLHPLPVRMVDVKGNDVQFPVISGGSGGRGDFFTIKDIQTSSGTSIIDNDGFVKVTGNFSVSASGSTTVALVNVDGTYYNSDNPFPITAPNTLPVTQVSGAAWSTSVGGAFTAGDGASPNAFQFGIGSQGYAAVIPYAFNGASYDRFRNSSGEGGGIRTQQATDSVSSVVVNSGTITAVTTITNSVAATIVDSSGVAYSGSNPLPTSATLTLPSGQGDAATATRVVIAGNSDASVVVNSGTLTAVTSITNSVGTVLVDSGGVAYSGSNPVPTTATISLPSGQGDAATATRMVIAGNSDASVVVNSGTLTAVTSITNSIAATILDESGSPWQPFTYAQGDVATAQRVVIAGNSDASVVVNSGTLTAVTSITNSVAAALVDSSGVAYSGSNPLPTTGSATLSADKGQGDAATALRVVIAGNSDASVVVNSGTITTVTTVTGVTNSIQVVALDRDGNPLTTGPIAQGDVATALRVVVAGNSDASVVVNSGTITAVTSITNSVAASIVDSSGIQYSGTNPVPVTVVTNAASSTLAVGDSAARAADNGGNPVKVGGIARTTNPAAFADGDRSNFGTDKIGRQLTRPLQVRDLTKTAYATLSTGTETTLLAAVAGAFLDPVFIMGTNTCTAAIQVDLRAVTAGNIVMTWMLPASTGPIGLSLPIGWPQDATGNNWTVDMGDFTNTTLYFSGLFTQEI